MRAFRDIPIQHKLVVIIMSITTSALLLTGLGVMIMDSVIFRNSMKRDIAALSQIVGDNSTAALEFDDPRVATETPGNIEGQASCGRRMYLPDGWRPLRQLLAGRSEGSLSTRNGAR